MRTALFSVASRVLLTRHYSLPGHESFFRAFSISGTAAWLFLRNRPFSIDGGWAGKGEWEGELVGGLVGWWVGGLVALCANGAHNSREPDQICTVSPPGMVASIVT